MKCERIINSGELRLELRKGANKVNHEQFVYKPEKKTRLKNFDPNFTADFSAEQEAQANMQKDADDVAKYQDILMAHETHGVLVIFQAMDGAGKDATIKHVMSSLEPRGCELKMFKEQTKKELKHDYQQRAA